MTAELKAALEQACVGGVEYNVDLARMSRWRVGGVADCVVRPQSIAQLMTVQKLLTAARCPFVVIGATSNLLFTDERLRAVCVQIGEQFAEVTFGAATVTVEAGAWVPGVARKLMQAGYTGAEHICGIPGTMGGLICMNGGSQRKGIGANVVTVTSLTRAGELVTREREACGFGYRQSVFQTNHEIILQVELAFEKASNKAAVRREMLSILRSRRMKFPRQMPNCGSVFKSNPAMYAEVGPPGAAIERLGLKGLRLGDAQISPQHGNFIVNHGRASAWQILALIQHVARCVQADTGFLMDVETSYVDAFGVLRDPLDVDIGDSFAASLSEQTTSCGGY